MEKNKKRKALNMALSVFLAVALWMYVGETWNPDDSATFRGLTVEPVGEELLESRGLIIVGDIQQTVTLKVAGPRRNINRLSSSQISLSVDVSGVQQPGEYTLAYRENFDMPTGFGASSLTVTERFPDNVTFTVARSKSRSVPVRGFITGSVAEGYQVGEFVFSPAAVNITGEETLVDQIDYVRVALDQQDMSESFLGELPISLVTYSGEILDLGATNIQCDVALVQTRLPITQLKEVKLSVDLIPGGGISSEDFDKYVECKITPESIIVSGEEDVLEPLQEISLGDIDLAKILGSNTMTFPIPLDAELTNVSGIGEATVRLTVKGLTTATLEVDNIEFVNKPAGYRAEKVTTSRQIQIRGTEEAVASVTPSQIRIVADLENVVTATGTQTVPVKVYLGSRSDVGVVGEYNIVVSISRE